MHSKQHDAFSHGNLCAIGNLLLSSRCICVCNMYICVRQLPPSGLYVRTTTQWQCVTHTNNEFGMHTNVHILKKSRYPLDTLL